MSFSPVRNVRIKSLTPGAVVQLRLGKAAVKSPDDVTIEAKLTRHYDEGEKFFAVFEVTGADGAKTETTISRFPGATWRQENKYVSLISVDESTFTIQKAASPIQTDAIAEAVRLIEAESEDVYGAEQLVALLSYVQSGSRVNTEIKALANRLAKKLVDELSNLPAKEPVAV
jgi:hypothetical protein